MLDSLLPSLLGQSALLDPSENEEQEISELRAFFQDSARISSEDPMMGPDFAFRAIPRAKPSALARIVRVLNAPQAG
eukprot:2670433-Pyramimonas_sp.AAC.1